LVLTDGKRKKY
jgi:hypothetical protein